METIEAMNTRRSVRRFKVKDIGDAVIEELIRLGNLAPSAGNLQPRDFVIVRKEQTKNRLAKAALNQSFLAEAPVVIVVCINRKRSSPYGRRGRELYCIQDSAASIQNMLLAIVDCGLASCWVGAFDEDAVSAILELPAHVRPVALLPIGYAQKQAAKTSRIDIKELIHYERW